MTSLKRSQTERSVGGSVPATDEFYTRRLPNGAAPPPRSESAHLSSCSPGVPKMGVRARVADWPPRKDSGGAVWHVALEADAPPSSAPGGGQVSMSNRLGHLMSPQDSNMLRNIHNTLKSKAQAAAAAAEGHDGRFLSPDDQRGSSRRAPRRARQRSNSDITLSELDGGGSDGGEDWGSPGCKWSPIHREYGSTSSIDKHGPAGESFFDMLKGYQGDKPDQRSPAPDRLGDLLTISHKQPGFDLPDGPSGARRGSPSSRLKERDKPLKRRSKSETGGDSIFRKLRSARAEGDSSRAGSDTEDGRSEDGGPPFKPWVCQKGFAHFDVQSILFDLNEVAYSRQTSAKLKNTTTGASAAAAASASSSLSSTHSAPYSSPCGSQEELSAKDSAGLDAGDDRSNELVLNCPCFRNEIGGEGERKISLSKLGSIGSGGSAVADGNPFESSLSTHCTNAGVAVLEVPKDSQGMHVDRGKRYIVEHVDLGAYYYRKYFYLRGESFLPLPVTNEHVLLRFQ